MLEKATASGFENCRIIPTHLLFEIASYICSKQVNEIPVGGSHWFWG